MNKNCADMYARPTLIFLLFVLTTMLLPSIIQAEEFGGIEFPGGVDSFADEVLQFDCLHSGGPCASLNQILDKALGPPDDVDLSLGRGGLVELLFVDNVLTNSGDTALDLYIFEIGADVEDTFVSVRPTAATATLLGASFDADLDEFYKIGKVFGSTSSIDIDAFFPGFLSGELQFDAVQLIDDPDEGYTTGSQVGADIDSVGAISSQLVLVQVPAVTHWGLFSLMLALLLALSMVVARHRRLSRKNV